MTEEHLTLEERAYNYETMRHIERVRNLLNWVIKELLDRAEKHDASKLTSSEVGILAKAPPLKDIVYNSPEYHASLAFVKPALDHHYAKNRHHPQHFENGIKDMNLIDLLEMILDWKASGERHTTGNLFKSINENRKRFNMSDEIAQIFNNTAHLLEGK